MQKPVKSGHNTNNTPKDGKENDDVNIGKELKDARKKADPYMKYMSAGFQILAPVILGVLAGMWLDRHFETDNSIYTIICSSVMILVALYQFIRQFLKP